MEPMNLKIGEKLKSIRSTRTLSLDDVAALTGVSKPMLGQIERGQSIPTVTTLWKIATGLKTSLSFFLEGQRAEYTIVGPDQRRKIGADIGLIITNGCSYHVVIPLCVYSFKWARRVSPLT